MFDCLLVVSPILHDLSPNFASLTPPPPPPLSPGAKLSTLSTWNFIKHSNIYGFSPQTFKFDTSPLTGKTNTEIIAFQNGHFFLSEILIQWDSGIQYFGCQDKKFGNVFKIALTRAIPGLHEFTFNDCNSVFNHRDFQHWWSRVNTSRAVTALGHLTLLKCN